MNTICGALSPVPGTQKISLNRHCDDCQREPSLTITLARICWWIHFQGLP